MKVAQINAVYGILSTGRSTKEIADFLHSYGHECVCFYGEKRGQWDDVHYVGCWLDHKLHAVLNRVLGRRGYGSRLVTLGLIRKLKRFAPDVVHLQNLHGNFVNIPLLLGYLAKYNVPTVLTLHDCFFFTGGCMHYTLNGCYQWRTNECSSCKYLHKGKDYWFVNGANYDLKHKYELFSNIPRLAVIGVSDWIQNQAKQSKVLGGATIFRRIYNWVDLEVFRPMEFSVCQSVKKHLGVEGRFMILGVSSVWTEQKGLYDFVALAKRLPSEYVVVLVGKVPSNVDLPENIIAVPPTSNVRELAEYYSSADVFVHLSREETFGKVTAEALACGTPCVVVNSTANPELIGENCGYVIDSVSNMEDVVGLLAKIRTNGKTQYSESCRRFAVAVFDKEKNLQQHINLYREINSI